MNFSIEHIPALNALDLPEASRLLHAVRPQPIACNNWSERFPYTPEVRFYIAHNDQQLFLQFEVREEYTMARVATDNGQSWTDSCVELFIALDDRGYYNFEFTCIGKLHLGFRKERPYPVFSTPEILDSVRHFSTLGDANFDERTGSNHWTLTVAIPVTAFFCHRIKTLSGIKASMNLYKCGDNLSRRHYLTWQPVGTSKPDFHTPAFFTPAEFL